MDFCKNLNKQEKSEGKEQSKIKLIKYNPVLQILIYKTSFLMFSSHLKKLSLKKLNDGVISYN